MNFTNGAQLLEYCEKNNKKISEAMFERETVDLENDVEKTRARMKKAWSIMKASANKPLKEEIVSMGGMIGGESKKLHALREEGKNLIQSFRRRRFRRILFCGSRFCRFLFCGSCFRRGGLRCRFLRGCLGGHSDCERGNCRCNDELLDNVHT